MYPMDLLCDSQAFGCHRCHCVCLPVATCVFSRCHRICGQLSHICIRWPAIKAASPYDYQIFKSANRLATLAATKSRRAHASLDVTFGKLRRVCKSKSQCENENESSTDKEIMMRGLLIRQIFPEIFTWAPTNEGRGAEMNLLNENMVCENSRK